MARVAFEDREAARAALELDGCRVVPGGEVIRVFPEFEDAAPRNRKKLVARIGRVSDRGVRVEDAVEFARKEELARFFEGCGKIESVEFPVHEPSGEFLGHAEVTFRDPEACVRALRLNGQDIFNPPKAHRKSGGESRDDAEMQNVTAEPSAEFLDRLAKDEKMQSAEAEFEKMVYAIDRYNDACMKAVKGLEAPRKSRLQVTLCEADLQVLKSKFAWIEDQLVAYQDLKEFPFEKTRTF